MTILVAEIDYYPENLWADADARAFDSSGARWWCLHTKPRQEKAVARALREAERSFYLPQIFSDHRTPQGRRIRSLIPLFPSYVFLLGDDHDRVRAIQCNRLVGVLPVFDQRALDQDLSRIHTILGSGLSLAPEPKALPGMLVRVTSGPLAGLEGTVVRRGKGDHFIAMVRFLSRGASVELQDWQVEPIGES